ncbi:MAG: aminopeptidase, partial [Flavobacterium sp.]|nr:aminopeptidase [Flavobacterium sp.]
MKTNFSVFFVVIFLFYSLNNFAQHQSNITVDVNAETHILTVNQTLIYFNQTQDTLKNLVLNDWNNAYSSNNTPLAKRFSDEFNRSFHFTKTENRGSTNEIKITQNKADLNFIRTTENPDLIEIQIPDKILPNQKAEFQLSYQVKIPSDEFTKYGFGKNGKMYLRNWFLTPAKYENHSFIKYNNNNLDDIANAVADFEILIKFSEKLNLQSDLEIEKTENINGFKSLKLTGKNRNDFSIYFSENKDFENFKNDVVEVATNMNETKLDAIRKAILIDKIVQFTNQNIGKYPNAKITVSQADYDRHPLYGLNQLPYFISPFTNEFLFEIKFLKTYLNNFLKNSLQLDARKNNWIFDGIQVYTMMKYIDEFHPDSKMMGSVARLKLLKSFNLVNLDFNDQYSY